MMSELRSLPVHAIAYWTVAISGSFLAEKRASRREGWIFSTAALVRQRSDRARRRVGGNSPNQECWRVDLATSNRGPLG